MMLRNRMFKKVVIAGVGFMGGSLALALKKKGLAKEVVGLSRRQSSVMTAIKHQAIDSGGTDMGKVMRGADLVVLSTPIDVILEQLRGISSAIKRGCIVTDMGSVKSVIVDEALKSLSSPDFFVGSHPLCGSEKAGVEHAVDNLFEGATCIMTLTKKTNQVAKEKVKHMWSRLGCNVKYMDPEQHDRVLGCTSHLPHVLAYGLMAGIPTEMLADAPKSLRDFTRIASSSPKIWNDICMSNEKNILHGLDTTVEILSQFRKAIMNHDEKTLLDIFSQAKDKRDSIHAE